MNQNRRMSTPAEKRRSSIENDKIEDIELADGRSVICGKEEVSLMKLREIAESTDAMKYLGLVVTKKERKNFDHASDANVGKIIGLYRSPKFRFIMFVLTFIGVLITISASGATLLCKYVDFNFCGKLDQLLKIYNNVTNHNS